MPSQKKKSTTEAGTEFEQQLAQYYESLGYRVVRNLVLSGHQIDLVASKDVPGAGVVNVMVEAKYRKSGVVGINDISNSLAAATRLLNEQLVSSAVIIASTAFSTDARSAVQNQSNVQLLTLHDLQQQLFNSSESLLRSVHDYASNRISHEYIDLPATSYSSKRQVKSIADHLYYHCSHGGQLHIILGDFGSGKSTILERVFIKCANERLRDPAARFPIFLRLRSLRQHTDTWSFVSANLRDQQYITPPKHVFEAQLNAGRLVIFLDGFDEIYAGASVADRGRFLAQLYELLNSRSPCILSSRPTYFSSPHELLRALSASLGKEQPINRTPGDNKTRVALSKVRKSMGLASIRPVTNNLFDDIWTIDQLSEERILAYLTQQEEALKTATGKTASQIRAVLDRVYDLSDLMRRPLLLKMVVQTILSSLIDINKQDLAIGPSTLYETYTQFSFDRDSEKRGTGSLSADSRRNVCQFLSLAMTRQGATELSDADVRKCIIASWPSITHASESKSTTAQRERGIRLSSPSESDIESVLTDIRLGSFLSFGQEGTLRFAHKSYMEFFVAQYMCQAALEDPDAISKVGDLPFNREVIYFLGSYARDLPKFGEWIAQRAKMNPRRTAFSREAALRTMFASGTVLTNSRIENVTIPDVELRRATVTSAVFDKLTLRDAVISDVVANTCSMSACVFEKCSIASTSFSRSNLEIEARESSLTHASIEGGALTLSGREWSFDYSTVKDATVRLSGSGVLGNVRFDGCTLNLATESRAGHRFAVTGSTFSCQAEEPLFGLDDNVLIRNSLILGLVFPLEEVLSILRLRLDASVENRTPIDESNRGIVFVDTRRATQAMINRWELHKSELSQRFGKLEFVEQQLYQRAVKMTVEKRKAAIQILKSRSDVPLDELPSSHRENVAAVKLATKFADIIRTQNWIAQPGLNIRVREMKERGFL